MEHGSPKLTEYPEILESASEDPDSTIESEQASITIGESLEIADPREKDAAPKIPSVVESVLTNKTVVFSAIGLAGVLVAALTGGMIGIAIFNRSVKTVAPARPDNRDVTAAPVLDRLSSAVRNVQVITVTKKSEERRHRR